MPTWFRWLQLITIHKYMDQIAQVLLLLYYYEYRAAQLVILIRKDVYNLVQNWAFNGIPEIPGKVWREGRR